MSDLSFLAVRHYVTEPEWELFRPIIDEIEELKRERNAIVLAHNYQRVEIFQTVADVTGDSLELARAAARANKPVIVMCGVRFMAETAKIMNPDKRVLLPHRGAGCSLADSIDAADVDYLRARYPGRPIVVYVNTSAEVKAAADICCTSSNAARVVQSLGVDEVVLAPDSHLAHYVEQMTGVTVHAWQGRCSVHDVFTSADVSDLRKQYPDVAIAAHPECRPEVQEAADYVGSTSQLVGWLDEARPRRVALITECTMSDNIAGDFPETQFVQPCALCPFMRRITLESIRDALLFEQHAVELPVHVMQGARLSLARMLALG